MIIPFDPTVDFSGLRFSMETLTSTVLQVNGVWDRVYLYARTNIKCSVKGFVVNCIGSKSQTVAPGLNCEECLTLRHALSTQQNTVVLANDSKLAMSQVVAAFARRKT